MFIGAIDIREEEYPQQREIGYWLGVPYWGKGFGTEAVRLAISFAFQYLDAFQVSAVVFVGNEASKRVLTKNGFLFDRTLRRQSLKRGEWKDEWIYTLSRDEWEGPASSYPRSPIT